MSELREDIGALIAKFAVGRERLTAEEMRELGKLPLFAQGTLLTMLKQRRARRVSVPPTTELAGAGEALLDASYETAIKALKVMLVADDFIKHYTTERRTGNGAAVVFKGCSNCGGVPHSSTCFVGRFQEAMGE